MQQKKYDAVVVLGGGLRKENERYDPATYEDSDDFGMLGGHVRVQAAAQLYRAEAASCFMFTTGVYEKNKQRLGADVPAEAETYAQRFKELITDVSGVPEIVLDTVSTTTLTNVQEIIAALISHKWQRIAIVSNEYHVPRIRVLYEHILRTHPELQVHIEYLAAERVLKELQSGFFDTEIDLAYQSEEGRKRERNEAQGLRDLQEGRYALKEFQLKNNMTRIMAFGTFDMIHAGHEDFFRQARGLADNPFLIVSVARDRAAGKHRGVFPRHSENDRLAALQKHPLIDTAILGDDNGYIAHIVRESPDIIALGYDQGGEYVENLERDLKAARFSVKVIRLKSFEPEKYKTSRILGKQ